MKDALTRKVGPLPMWAWFLLLFGVIYYYRKYVSGSSSLSSSSLTPTSATSPQAQTLVPAGDSLYDPNTGQLVTAPGGSGGSGSGGTDIGAAMDQLANAIANGMQVTTSSGMTPGSTSAPAGPPPNQPAGTMGKPKLSASAFNKRFNQRFNQQWRQKLSAKRARSAATIRTQGRAQQPRAGNLARRTRTLTSRAIRPTATVRQRPTHGATRAVVRQHHVTSMPKQRAPVAHIPPRPSAPAARTQRYNRAFNVKFNRQFRAKQRARKG